MSPTRILALINCTDILPLFDIIEDITKDFILKKCISKAGNICYLVESDIKNNTELYNILNNLDLGESILDCRFVGDEYIFKDEEIIVIDKDNINKDNINKDNINKDNIDKDNIDNNNNININKDNINKNNIDKDNNIDKNNNVEKESAWLNLNDERFNKIYSDVDYFIDTSHNDYKKNGFLKYFIEEKRRRN